MECGGESEMKYIIMCGGKYTKWDKPRQLIEINGIPNVERTIMILRFYGVDDIAISTNDERFNRFDVPILHHENNYEVIQYNQVNSGLWCNAFYLTNEPVTYLFGDVIYSDNAIRTIIDTETDDVAFFGSCPPFAPEYPKPYIEPFGFKVVNTEHFHQAIQDVKRLYQEHRFRREPIAWELWNVISRGADGDVNNIDFGYVHINDYTCDIDTPDEIGFVERIEGVMKMDGERSEE